MRHGAVLDVTAGSAILPGVEEQRTEKAVPVPLVQVAGTDPAYIPGLTAPSPAAGPGADADTKDAEEATEAQAEDAAEDADGPQAEPAAAVDDDAAWDDDADGPYFEASDREGAVTANRAGVRFRLVGEEARFPWAEVGAVEVGTPRFGRRLTVTVYTTDRRRYEAEVDAPSRGRLREWDEAFDAVLDAYFEES